MTHAKKLAKTLQQQVHDVCQALSKLDPGPLADLRRTSSESRAPEFWRLVARYELARSPDSESRWASAVQALAILTPKGRDTAKPSRHKSAAKTDSPATEGIGGGSADAEQAGGRTLGSILVDGGNPGWPDGQSAQPMLSEKRLAQLLASTGSGREDMTVRVARLLAANIANDVKFDCTDLARLIVEADPTRANRNIARDYYARLDRRRRQSDTSNGDDA